MSLSRETSVALLFGSLIGFWPNSIIIFPLFLCKWTREKSHIDLRQLNQDCSQTQYQTLDSEA